MLTGWKTYIILGIAGVLILYAFFTHQIDLKTALGLVTGDLVLLMMKFGDNRVEKKLDAVANGKTDSPK